MDKEIMDTLQYIVDNMATKAELKEMETRINAKMLTRDDVEPLSDRSASKAATLVEERLGKRIDALFDGYKLTHEKQWELERKVETLEKRLEALESRIA